MTVRVAHRIAAAALVAALGGCAVVAPIYTDPAWDVARVARAPAPADPLPAGLRDGYLRLAAAERDRHDWRDAAAFLQKAQRATDGATPPPFTLADRPIRSDALRIPLAAAEPQMLALLGSPGARLRAPREIARMQIDWECWIQAAEEGRQTAEIDACGTAFAQSLSAAKAAAQLPEQLVVVLPEEDGQIGGVVLATGDGGALLLDRPFAAGSGSGEVAVLEGEVRDIFAPALNARPTPPRFFTIYFDFGALTLDADAGAIVAQIVEDVRRRPSPEVLLTGHADAVGDADANLRIARARARAVRDAIAAALGRDGAARISAASRGEADPATPTPTAERRNRRVEVTVR